jgi:anti-anti-sigma factor
MGNNGATMAGAARRLDVVVGRALGTVLVTVRGELDASTARELHRCVSSILAERPERLVIDLNGVVGLDDDGAAALRRARRRAERAQVQLQLTSRRPRALDGLAADGFTFV